MAEVERVINLNFIKSLERNRTAINSAFEYFNSDSSFINHDDVLNIFTNILNPLFDDGSAVPDSTVISIFRSILKLISKGLIGNKGRFKDLERLLLLITSSQRMLLSEHGEVFILNIFNALLNLKEKQIDKIDRWASILSTLSPATDIETFRKAGFVLAWRLGAAGGREIAAEIIPALNTDILELIFETEKINDSARSQIYETITHEPWLNPVADSSMNSETFPVFRNAGGFSGFGREFRSTPAVALIDDYIYATDGTEVFRLYADYYGTELRCDRSIKPDCIRPGGVINRFIKAGNFLFNNKSQPLPHGWKSDITSIAVNRHCIVWTLRDSYKLYIAGITEKHAWNK